MKTVFLILGESGVGKDSLVNAACEKRKMNQLISYTTRPRRTNESNTHVFIQSSEIAQYENDMVASTVINNNTYFATREQLKDCDFYIIDRNGMMLLKDKLKDDNDFRFVTIYITASFEKRYERASKRGDNTQTFFSRSLSEQNQFILLKMNTEYDYVLVNNDFEKTLKVFESIIDIEMRAEK